jgi:hypothetical protein
LGAEFRSRQVVVDFYLQFSDIFSVKPIFGARFPPISDTNNDHPDPNNQPMNTKNGQRFKQYESRLV